MNERRWRYQGWPMPYVGAPLEVERSALMIIDMQRYWTDTEGPMARHLREQHPQCFAYFYERLGRTVIPALSQLIGRYRQLQLPIVHVVSGTMRSDGRDLAPHLQRRIAAGSAASAQFQLLRIGSHWREVTAELAPQPNELILNKTTRSAFHSTAVDQLLRHMGVSQLVVGGLATNGCVDLSARDAADLGYETFLIADACATFSEEAHEPVLVAFNEVFGTVLSAEEALLAAGAG